MGGPPKKRPFRGSKGCIAIESHYYYDPFGRRLWKEVAGVRTYFVYADEGLVAEVDEAGNVVKSYGYRPGSTWTTDPLFMKVGSNYYFYQNDHLGTPQKLTAVNGAVVWSAKYSSFGKAEIVPSSTVSNNLRFPGQYYDEEIRIHYNYYRYYDTVIGRYQQSDPIGLKGGVNYFTYVRNRPINLVDPFGLLDAMDSFNYFHKGKIPKGFPPDYDPANYKYSDIYKEFKEQWLDKEWRIGRGLGYEYHLLGGGGPDTFYCCDSNHKKWRIRTQKSCRGFAALVSGGSTAQYMNKNDCPNGYAGEYFEIGAFIVEVGLPTDLAYDDEDSLEGSGIGLSAGIGFKMTICNYTIIEKEIIGCCDK